MFELIYDWYDWLVTNFLTGGIVRTSKVLIVLKKAGAYGLMVTLFFCSSVSATAHAHLWQAVQPGEQQCQWEQGEPLPPSVLPPRASSLFSAHSDRPSLFSASLFSEDRERAIIKLIYLCLSYTD